MPYLKHILLAAILLILTEITPSWINIHGFVGYVGIMMPTFTRQNLRYFPSMTYGSFPPLISYCH